MIRRPPRSTLTDTLFPYTTLFRSHLFFLIFFVHPSPSHILPSRSSPVRLFISTGVQSTILQDFLHPARFCPEGRERNLRRECRSEEHTSELQSLMRISYAVFCLKKKNIELALCITYLINHKH